MKKKSGVNFWLMCRGGEQLVVKGEVEPWAVCISESLRQPAFLTTWILSSTFSFRTKIFEWQYLSRLLVLEAGEEKLRKLETGPSSSL